MLSALRRLIVVALTGVVGACATTKPVAIFSNPEAASIQVNGQQIGTTPTEYTFRFSENNTIHRVRASKVGYHDANVMVS